jgi:hypothetical protein
MGSIRSHLSFANVMSVIAVFIALGGAAYAAVKLPKNSVGTKQLKKSAVTSAKVADGTLEAADFKKGLLLTGSVGPVGPQGPAGATGGAAATPVRAVSVTNSGTVSYSKNAISAMPFNTELFDTANMHSAGSPSRLVAPVEGIYDVSATISFASNAEGARELFINVNSSGVNPFAAASVPGSAASTGTMSASGLIFLKAGDYVEASAVQTGPASLNVLGTGNLAGPRFSMFYVGSGS